jgi:hypothetical protein
MKLESRELEKIRMEIDPGTWPVTEHRHRQLAAQIRSRCRKKKFCIQK